jgi:hypothetical protein
VGPNGYAATLDIGWTTPNINVSPEFCDDGATDRVRASGEQAALSVALATTPPITPMNARRDNWDELIRTTLELDPSASIY